MIARQRQTTDAVRLCVQKGSPPVSIKPLDFAIVSRDIIHCKNFGRLQRKLGSPERRCVTGLLVELFLYCCRHYPDGVLREVDAEDLAWGLEWRGDPGVLWDALRGSGWLVDQADGSVKVHKWEHWTGRALEKREGWVEQKREQRARKREGLAAETREHSTPEPNVRTDTRGQAAESALGVGARERVRDKEEVKISSAGVRVADPVPVVTLVPVPPPPPESDLFKPRAVIRSALVRQAKVDPADVVAVAAHYRKHQPDTPDILPGSREWQAIAARLAEGFTVAQLCEAIDGMHASPFHRGLNDSNMPHLGLELACRSSDKVRSFQALLRNRNRPILDSRQQRGMVVAAKWATDGEASFSWEGAANGA